MSPTTMRLVIDDADVRAMLQRAPEQVQERIGQLVQGAAIDIQAELRLASPVGATGDLRRSVRYTYTPSLLQAEILPEVAYADAVETGSKPHYVSVAPGTPLRRWAQMKGINPYALRNKIAQRGTKAHPFIVPTYDKMKPQVENDLAHGIATLIGDLTR